jgi:hypothetical protein
MVVALAPFDSEPPAGQRDFDRAVGALLPRRSDRGRAGCRAEGV